MRKNVAVIGCGNISDIYLSNLTNVFENVTVYAVCDLDNTKAEEKANKYNTKVMSFEDILANKDIDIVLNLTTPSSHYDICKKAILAKKNTYVEKPLSSTYSEGKELVELALREGVLLGCAPDTFMGAGIHTARKIIDDGLIGDVVGTTAFMLCPGHESWHPSPEFYYKKGGGPLFDMGPYYITALINLIGSVHSVSGMSNCLRKKRKITSEPKRGTFIEVDVDTYVNGLLRFNNGAIGNLITSFDVYGTGLSKIEVYGTKGSIIVPDPNCFGGAVLLKQSFDTEFRSFPLINRFSANSRGLGVADMADCLINGTQTNCANGKVGLHTLEIMEKILLSNHTKQEMELESTCNRPEISKLI